MPILHADEICKEPLHIQLLKLITSIAILPLFLFHFRAFLPSSSMLSHIEWQQAMKMQLTR